MTITEIIGRSEIVLTGTRHSLEAEAAAKNVVPFGQNYKLRYSPEHGAFKAIAYSPGSIYGLWQRFRGYVSGIMPDEGQFFG
ncbi:hypothetical protein HYV85_02175 [Candidatus Woesearchaeota archaeon]|nr:hypothetical protein [Candidatus Woesearchaeota archaeon]